MPILVSESEMLERFVDGLKKSSSASKEIRVNLIEKRPQIFSNFINGIKVAAGSAHQLAHSQQNHQWLGIRDFLEKIIDTTQTLVTFNNSANKSWETIETSLKALIEKGTKIATSKAITRPDLLAGINLRELRVREKLREEHGESRPTD